MWKWMSPYQQRAPDMLHQVFLGIVVHLLLALKNTLDGHTRNNIEKEIAKIRHKGLRVSDLNHSYPCEEME